AATDIRKEDIRKDKEGESMEVLKVMKSGHSFFREQWNSRPVKFCHRCSFSLIFEDIPTLTMNNEGHVFCEDCTQKIEKASKEVFCLPCNCYHSEKTMKGHMTHAEWTTLSVACHWKIQYKEKFAPIPTPTREILSIKKPNQGPVKPPMNYVCTACGQDFPENMMSTEEEDLCSECYKRFHQSTAVNTTFAKRVDEKVVWNGMRVTKTMWEKMNGCRCCVRRIPFDMADKVHFMGGAPVCSECADELHL
ncbi:MAG: hypothetical protein ACRC0F_05690, partial [Cetobacterium sp.]